MAAAEEAACGLAGMSAWTLPLLIGVFCPLAAPGGRAEDIAYELTNFDVFVLLGTKTKAPPGYSHGLQQDGTDRLIIESGRGPGVYTYE